MLHVLQAFGGPGRTAVSFAPTYSMYPEYARDTHTRWVTGQREDDFTVDPDRAVALIGDEQPDVVLLASPNNPTGTALRSTGEGGRSTWRPASSWSTRRTPSSAAAARRPRSSCSTSIRACSSRAR